MCLIAVVCVCVSLGVRVCVRRFSTAAKTPQAGHDNIADLREIQAPESEASFDDLYLVSTRADSDLYQILRSGQDLSDDHVQYFVHQALCGLKYIHSGSLQFAF